MKVAEARAFIADGAIDRAVLYRRGSQDWQIFLYGENLPSSVVNYMEANRGGACTWHSLDVAHDWLMNLADGVRFPVETDGPGRSKETKAGSACGSKAREMTDTELETGLSGLMALEKTQRNG